MMLHYAFSMLMSHHHTALLLNLVLGVSDYCSVFKVVRTMNQWMPPISEVTFT